MNELMCGARRMIDSAMGGRGNGPESPGSVSLRRRNDLTETMTKLMTLRGMLVAQNMSTVQVDVQINDLMSQQIAIGPATLGPASAP
jgi:hypothetical protein